MAPRTRRQRVWIVCGVAGLLAALFLQLAFSARDNSITWDEDDHIYAGYMSWKHADFGLNPEHPPLVKLVAALPLLNLPLKMPALQNRFFKLEAFLGGKDFFSRMMRIRCCCEPAWLHHYSLCSWQCWFSLPRTKCLGSARDLLPWLCWRLIPTLLPTAR